MVQDVYLVKEVVRRDGNSGKSYRFLTFAERVNNIDVDVFHRVAELQLAPGQSSTFFLQTLNTWQDINFTAQFTRLCAELKPFVDNLPLLLHHKEQVIGILLKYIDLHAKGFEIVDDAAPDRSDEQVGGDQLSFLGERAVSGGKKHHHVDSGAHLASNLKQKAGKHGKRRGGDADGDGDGDGDGGGSGMAQKRRHRRGDQVTILASDGVTKLRKIHSTATAIKPLLELVAALARDLQDEFYVYFPRVLSALMELIDPQDPNLLELVFSCIGMIFKCLHRLMLDDMPNVFTLYRSFLFTERVSGARKSFIRNFAAETFSFLLRKIKSRHRLTSLLDFMLQSVTAQDLAVDQSIAIDGLSRLFFQTIKGVQRQFHSNLSLFFGLLLRKLQQPPIDSDAIFRIISGTWHLVCYHSRVDHSFPVWQCILEELSDALQTWQQCSAAYDKTTEAVQTTPTTTTTSSTLRASRKRPQPSSSTSSSSTTELGDSEVANAARAAGVRLYRIAWLVAYMSSYSGGDRVPDALLAQHLGALGSLLKADLLFHPLQHPALVSVALDWLAGLTLILCAPSRPELTAKNPIEMYKISSAANVFDDTLHIDRNQLVVKSLSPLVAVAFTLPSVASVLHLVRRSLEHIESPSHFSALFLGRFIEYCSKHIATDTTSILVALHHVIQSENWSRTSVARLVSLEHHDRITLTSQQQTRIASVFLTLFDSNEEWLQQPIESDNQQFYPVWLALRCLQSLHVPEVEAKLSTSISRLMQALIDRLTAYRTEQNAAGTVVHLIHKTELPLENLIAECWLTLCSLERSYRPRDFVASYLPKALDTLTHSLAHNCYAWEALVGYLDTAMGLVRRESTFDRDAWQSMATLALPILQLNLLSPNAKLRLACASCLVRLSHPLSSIAPPVATTKASKAARGSNKKAASDPGDATTIDWAMVHVLAERFEQILSNSFRTLDASTATAAIDSFVPLIDAGRVKHPSSHALLTHFLLGIFHIRYTPAWKSAQRAVVALAGSGNFAAFWSIFSHLLQESDRILRLPHDSALDRDSLTSWLEATEELELLQYQHTNGVTEIGAEEFADLNQTKHASKRNRKATSASRKKHHRSKSRAPSKPFNANANANANADADADADDIPDAEEAAIPDAVSLSAPAADSIATEAHFLWLQHVRNAPSDLLLCTFLGDSTDLSTFYATLWQTLCSIPQLAEGRARDLVPIFLSFMQQIYRPAFVEGISQSEALLASVASDTSGTALTDTDETQADSAQNAADDDDGDKNSEDNNKDDNLADAVVADELDDIEETAGQVKRALPRYTIACSGRLITQRLIGYLTLIGKFKNPRAVPNSEQVYEWCLQLLCRNSPDVQQAALNCIFAWEHKYLTPYKANLLALIDERSFRRELGSWNVERHVGTLVEKDREHVLPILARILFGKLLQRRGVASSAPPQVRRRAILTFLSTLEPQEMEAFFGLLFAPFQGLLDTLPTTSTTTSTTTTTTTTEDEFDESLVAVCMVSLRAQRGFLAMLEDMLKQLRRNAIPYLPRLLHVLISILRAANLSEPAATEQRERFSQYAAASRSALSSLRSLSFQRLADVIGIFPQYDFSPWLNEHFFRSIHDNILRIPTDNSQHCTALLTFFCVMGSHSELAPMLALDRDILPSVMACFSSPHASLSVLSMALELIENLVKDQEAAELQADIARGHLNPNAVKAAEEPEFDDDDEHARRKQLLDEARHGLSNVPQPLKAPPPLLAPHINLLFEHMQELVFTNRRLARELAAETKAEAGAALMSATERRRLQLKRKLGTSEFENRQLALLCKISGLATDGARAQQLADLLLPFLDSTRNMREETRTAILSLLKNLIHLLDEPVRFGTVLAPLFELTLSRTSRRVLCDTARELACYAPMLRDATRIIDALHAYSEKLIDEYDFDTRLEAFNEIQAGVRERSFDEVGLLLLVHNLLFFIHDADLSISSSAEQTLSLIISEIGRTCSPPVSDTNPAAAATTEPSSIAKSNGKSNGKSKSKSKSKNQSTSESQPIVNDRPWLLSIEQLRALLNGVILRVLVRKLTHSTQAVRFVAAGLLSTCIRSDTESPYRDLLALTSDKPERDFFHNIFHMQLHRATSVLAHCRNVCRAAMPSTLSLSRVLIPILTTAGTQELKPENAIQRRAKKMANYNASADPLRMQQTLLTEVARTLGVLCKRLPWKQYYSLLTRYLDMVPRFPKLEENLLRLCIEIIDAYHFHPKNKALMQEENIPSLLPVTLPEITIPPGADDDDKKADDDDNEEDEDDDDDNDDDGDNKEDGDDAQHDSAQAMSIDTQPTATSEVASSSSSASSSDDLIDDEQIKAIHMSLARRVVPAFFTFLKNERAYHETAHVDVAVAIAKVLQLLPIGWMRRDLPRLLHLVVERLKSREQRVRDETRRTLQRVVAVLGPTHFSYVVRELRSSLNRGYMLHVLGFTVHSLLLGIVPQLKGGELDHCMDLLVQCCLEDIIGEVAEKKEVKAIADKLKEAQSTQSYDSFELLARVVTPETHLEQLVGAVRNVLVSSVSLKVVTKMQESLRRILAGLLKNPNLNAPNALVIAYRLIVRHIDVDKIKKAVKAKRGAEDGSSENATRQEEATSNSEPRQQPRQRLQSKVLERISNERYFLVELTPRANMARDRDAGNTASDTNMNLLAELGLSLVYLLVKRGRVPLDVPQHREMLDPYVKILQHCLRSKFTAVTQQALKCLALLLPLEELPSVTKRARTILKRCFTLMHTNSTRSKIYVACLRCVTVIIQRCGNHIKPSTTQLQLLVQAVHAELDQLQHRDAAFSMLAAIIKHRLLVPELYDLMEHVGKLVVTAESGNVRVQCGKLFLQFLLHYPLGEKRLQQHIDFVLRNLGYEHDSGREAALDLLYRMVNRFPKDIIKQQAEYMLVPLVLRLVNDTSQACRAMAAEVIKLLLLAVEGAHFQSTYALVRRWYNDAANPVLQRAATQVVGLAIEVADTEAPNLLPNLLADIEAHLLLPVVGHDGEERDGDDNNKHDDHKDTGALLGGSDKAELARRCEWQIKYYSLLALEKLFTLVPSLSVSDKSATLWPIVFQLLLHHHAWVKASASRLLGIYLANFPIEQFERDPECLLRGYGVLTQIAKSCTVQLTSRYLTENTGQQTIKNLVYLTQVMARYPTLITQRGRVVSLGDGEQQQQQQSEADQIDEALDDEDEEEAQDEEEAHDQQPRKGAARAHRSKEDDIEPEMRKYWALRWLFEKMSFLGRVIKRDKQQQTIQRTMVFRWFAAMAMQLPVELTRHVLFMVVPPLHRVLNFAKDRGFDDELSELAAQVVEVLKNKVGVSFFAVAYSKAHEAMMQRRQTRKASHQVLAARDPARYATEKLMAHRRLNEVRKRKRKVADDKISIKVNRITSRKDVSGPRL